MPRTVYINGRYCAPEEATVSIFDRGLLFADAIYEVAGVIDGKLLDFASHMQRLDRSLVEMRMPAPLTHDEILAVMRELVKRDQVEEGLVYMQISRGSTGDRDFLPPEGMKPTVFMFAQHKSDVTRQEFQNGIKMISAPDIRWGRRAKEAGGAEVLMHQDGYVTEGGATSFYIIKDNTIITRPLSNDILHGCTRKALLKILEDGDIGLDERLYTLDEAHSADEAFITGASTFVCPVVQIDDAVLGTGKPGPVTRRLQDIYMDFIHKDAI